MATRSLPRRPSLEHLRNEARDLQRRVREGDPAALSRAREFHPRFAERADRFHLSDAQLTVARSYRHASWPKLKTYVEAIGAYTRDPHAITPLADVADEFLRLACLVYGGDDLSRPAVAAQMLRRDPSLAGRSIHTAAAAGDAVAAARMLGADRTLASTTGGPFGWEPLLYVAYSRLVSDDRSHSHVGVARLLLEDSLVFCADNDMYADRVALLLRHGVDPDGRGTQHPALRGLTPIERSHAAGAEKILELLVAAGAQPPMTDAVDALLGLCRRGERESIERELARNPALAATAIQRHPRALIEAAERCNTAGVELLAQIGYDVNLRPDGQAALHVAAYDGNREMSELLLSLGADPTIRPLVRRYGGGMGPTRTPRRTRHAAAGKGRGIQLNSRGRSTRRLERASTRVALP